MLSKTAEQPYVSRAGNRRFGGAARAAADAREEPSMTQQLNSFDPDPWLHRLAMLTALATFPLIFMGGLVTSHQAGMSVPDWPNSYGYNMFLFPPNQWVGGILYEHTHRLMGTVVGFLSIMLAASAYGPSRGPGARRAFGRLAVVAAVSGAVTAAVLLARHVGGGHPFSLRSSAMHGVVGLVSIAAVAAVLWRARTPEPRRWVRRLSLV